MRLLRLLVTFDLGSCRQATLSACMRRRSETDSRRARCCIFTWPSIEPCAMPSGEASSTRTSPNFVDPPKPQRREMQSLSPEQVRRFLRVVRTDRLEALYVLALTTGMRQGELLGLRWRDVDLAGRSL